MISRHFLCRFPKKFSLIFSIVLFGLSLTANALGQEPLRIGELAEYHLETSHPYPAGDHSFPVIWQKRISHPGATYIAVHFSRFKLAGMDYLEIASPDRSEIHIFNGKGRNNGGSFWALSILGDSADLKLYAGPQGGGYGFSIDKYAHGFVPLVPETICGSDDYQDAVCYQASDPEKYDKSRAVARVVIHGVSMCSGSLISCENHFMTNAHCYEGFNPATAVPNTELRFMFQRQNCGSGLPQTQMTVYGDSYVASNATLDYFIFTTQNNPQATFGYVRLDPRDLVTGEQFYFPQHPQGRPKEFGIDSDMDPSGKCSVISPSRNGNGFGTDFGYYCDSDSGSSGSPIISSESHRMIGLHHFGTGIGFCDSFNMNQAVKIKLISDQVSGILPACSFCDTPDPPTNLSASVNGPNEIRLTWMAVAGMPTYYIYRGIDNCNNLSFLASTTQANYIDNTVSGSIRYCYQVSAMAECESGLSNCACETATGICIEPPTFAGLEEVISAEEQDCKLILSWSPATPNCGASLSYNIYRSTNALFDPGPANLIQSCHGQTSFEDTDVNSMVSYYYVVRAEDNSGNGSGPCNGGNEDFNLNRVWGLPTGPPQLSEFYDDAEGSIGYRMLLEPPWERSNARAAGGSFSYSVPGTSPSLCSSMVTPSMRVGNSAVLSYSTWMDQIEDGWDGGTVEISVDGGSSWAKLRPSPNYPSGFEFTSSSCNNDFPTNLLCYTGNSSNWTNATVSLSFYEDYDVIIRFRFGTDDMTDSVAWYIDDIRITNVYIPGECGTGIVPPGEVSGKGSATPLKMVKETSGTFVYFEKIQEAVGYNIYEGTIPTYYEHGSIPFLCNPSTLPGRDPGELKAQISPSAGDHYYLLTAWNGDPVSGNEGTSGYDSTGAERPPDENTCDPINNN